MYREISAFAKMAKTNVMRLKYPYKLTHALTYKCNLKCKICKIWLKDNSNELNIENIERFYYNSRGFNWISFTGGEVFQRGDLTDIAKIAAEYCGNLCVLSIPTNGYDCETIVSAIEKMLSIGLARLYITVCLDGPPKCHDQIRGICMAWKRSIRTYRELKALNRLNVYLSMTLSDYNYDKIAETLESIKAEIPDFNEKESFNINIFHKSEHYYNNASCKSPDKNNIKTSVKQAHGLLRQNNIKGFMQNNYLKYCLKYIETQKSPLTCTALSSSCFLDPAGELYPCIGYNKPLGNIKDYDFSLQKMWDGEHAKETYKTCKTGNCPGCWTPCEAYQSIIGSLRKTIFTGGRFPF